jgi:hypothetical protein
VALLKNLARVADRSLQEGTLFAGRMQTSCPPEVLEKQLVVRKGLIKEGECSTAQLNRTHLRGATTTKYHCHVHGLE